MRHLKKSLSLIGLLFCLPSFVQAQQANVDSLRQTLHFNDDGNTADTDTSIVQTLNELATAYRLTDLDSTLKYAKMAAVKAKSLNFTKGFLQSQYLILTVYFNRGEYQKVYDIAQSALEKPETNAYPQQLAVMNQLIGISYASQGNYQQGLYYFFEARDLFRELGNDDREFQNMNNIGVSYLKLEDYKKALKIFLELDSLRTLEPVTISVPVNLGFIYYELKEYDKAKMQLMRVLDFEGAPFDQRALGLSTFKLGEIALHNKAFSEALAYFNRSINVYEKLQNEIEKVQSLNGTAMTYLEMSKLDPALSFAEKAFGIAHTNDALPEEQTSAETLYKVYKAKHNYREALSYLELSKSLSDSLKNEEISREVGKLEAEYEFKQRELKLLETQQQQNLKNAELIANRNIIILIGLALFMIAVTVAVLQYRNSVLRKKANKLLKEKNDHIKNQTEKLKEMNDIKTHLFSIISHDLRGPLTSLYGFITLNEINEISKEQIQDMIPELADKFKYTSNLLNNLLNWSRSQLDGYKIVPVSFNLGEHFEENYRVLSYQAKDKDIEILNDLENESTQVFADKNMINLVILNLLSNAIKFTRQGGNIRIWTESIGDHLKFCIQDNGVGIPSDKLELLFSSSNFYSTSGTEEEKGTGLGLMLCKEFISKNNGTIWAESEKGNGSTFYFTVPVSKEAFKA